MRVALIAALCIALAGSATGRQNPASIPASWEPRSVRFATASHPPRPDRGYRHFEPLPLGETDRSVNTYEIPERILLFGTFADVLNLDSSVDLEQRAPGVQGDISIRGGTVGQTLVLVNGMRVNDAQSAHHNFDVPAPLYAISEVQVLRGAGSTLYGSDAVAGVVNVITRVDPDTELRFRSGIGSFWDKHGGRTTLSAFGPAVAAILI